MKRKGCCIGLLVMAAFFLTATQAIAFDSSTSFENLMLFDSHGQMIASYHLDDFTSSVTLSGLQYKVVSEAYSFDVTDPPVVNPNNFVPTEGSAAAVPQQSKRDLPLLPLPGCPRSPFSVLIKPFLIAPYQPNRGSASPLHQGPTIRPLQ